MLICSYKYLLNCFLTEKIHIYCVYVKSYQEGFIVQYILQLRIKFLWFNVQSRKIYCRLKNVIFICLILISKFHLSCVLYIFPYIAF